MDILRKSELFYLNPPSAKFLLDDLIVKMGCKCADDYLDFMSKFNGGEGQIGDRILALWTIEEQIEVNSLLDNEDTVFASKYWIFGSNSGIFQYVFDKNNGEILEIDRYDDAYRERMGTTLAEFIYNLMQ